MDNKIVRINSLNVFIQIRKRGLPCKHVIEKSAFSDIIPVKEKLRKLRIYQV